MAIIDTNIQTDKFSGLFYPSDPAELTSVMDQFIGEGEPHFPNAPKAYIMPHAGYRFSGAAAGKVAKEMTGNVRRVVILSPSHRHPFFGIARSTAERFRTPLGEIGVEKRAYNMTRRLPFVRDLPEAFENEHGVEVIVPWVQHRFPKAQIAPFVIGKADVDEVNQLLDLVWGDQRTIIIVSTDLSHFMPEKEQILTDGATASNIEIGNIDAITSTHACGWMGLKGLMHAAKIRGMRLTRMNLSNSASVSGDPNRVVGYGSWVVHQAQTAQFPATDRATLNTLAARAIKYQLDQNRVAHLANYKHGHILQTNMASFVTLEKDDKLRGCIGSLNAHRPLAQDVFINAQNAAFKDRRFPPLSMEEFDQTDIEISVLSTPSPVQYKNRDDLLQIFENEKTGVVLSHAQHRATFLPKVWNQFTDADSFLKALMKKAGMPDNGWTDDIQIQSYRTEIFDKIALRDAV